MAERFCPVLVLAEELRAAEDVARENGLPMLAYVIGMAVLEAERILRASEGCATTLLTAPSARR